MVLMWQRIVNLSQNSLVAPVCSTSGKENRSQNFPIRIPWQDTSPYCLQCDELQAPRETLRDEIQFLFRSLHLYSHQKKQHYTFSNLDPASFQKKNPQKPKHSVLFCSSSHSLKISLRNLWVPYKNTRFCYGCKNSSETFKSTGLAQLQGVLKFQYSFECKAKKKL